MFEDSLLDSGRRQQTHRGATTLLSVAIQGLFVGALVIAPMIYTDTLPGFRLDMAGPILFTPQQQPPPLGDPRGSGTTYAGQMAPLVALPDTTILHPKEIPTSIDMTAGQEPVFPATGTRSGTGVPFGFPDGVLGGTGTQPVSLLPAPAVTPPLRVSQSVLDRGHLIRKVMPQYPEIARRTRVEGQVVLQAVIGRDGNMQSVRVLRGHALLAPAAEEAVRQWVYRPYMLNGQPTEVETQITVNFVLSR